MSIFLMESTTLGSSLQFSNYSQHHFDVSIKTAELCAKKKVYIDHYAASNGFVEYFQMLAQHNRSWDGEKVWETLEGELKLGATCNAWGHVRHTITLRDYKLDWSVVCSLRFDLGMLSQHARDAESFMTP